MPTLLSINNYFYYRGGAETVFLEHNRLFGELGWTVAPFSMQHPKNLPTPWSRYFVEEIEFGATYSWQEKLRRIPKTLYSFEARAKLAQLLEHLQSADIAHGHNLYHHLSPSILSLLKKRGIPTVLTLHDLKLACPAYNMLTHDGVCERCRGGRLYNVVVHKCIKDSTALSALVMSEAVLHRLLGSYRRNVSRFIVPSLFYLEKFCEWGMPRALFRHVPNFVSVENYRPEYPPGSTFVYVGRLSREKGVATLIRAAALASCRLIVVGTGPAQSELGVLATQLGADVVFAGYLRGEELHAAVRGARALVLPSECYENAPMSVLEAYALGKPVIGASIGGIPELIRPNETGLTFRSGDAQSLADALRQLASHSDDTIEAMGRRGRRWVEESFSAALYRERILSVYNELGVPGAAA